MVMNYCKNCGRRIRQITNILKMVVWIHDSTGEIACPSKTIAEPKYNQEAAKGEASHPMRDSLSTQSVPKPGLNLGSNDKPPRKSLTKKQERLLGELDEIYNQPGLKGGR